MNHTFRTVLSLLLCLLLLCPLASCGSGEGGDETGATGTSAAGETEAETDIYADLPKGTYNYTFNIIQYKETTAATCTVIPEEGDSSPIAEVIEARAKVVEDRLGVTFVNHLDSLQNVVTAFRNNVNGGLDEYDVVWMHSSHTVADFLTAGMLLPLDDAESLDLSKPWWDSTANDNLRLGEKTYLGFGDINIYLYDFHSTIVFDKEMTDALGKDMYGMVENGTWTMEEFISLATECAVPSDTGRGYSRRAIEGYADATMLGFLHGADVSLFTRDPDTNIPVLDGTNEDYLDVMARYSEFFRQSGMCDCKSMSYINDFAARKSAFISCGVGELGGLRGEEFDYGILPFPKRTADQKAYISFVSNQIQPMSLPVTASDIDRTGVILENLAAESYRMVRPQYFDVLLKYKYLRDEQSVNILNSLFENETRFELEHIYNWGDLEPQVTTALTGGNGSRFTSVIKRVESKVISAMEETLKYLNVD